MSGSHLLDQPTSDSPMQDVEVERCFLASLKNPYKVTHLSQKEPDATEETPPRRSEMSPNTPLEVSVSRPDNLSPIHGDPKISHSINPYKVTRITQTQSLEDAVEPPPRASPRRSPMRLHQASVSHDYPIPSQVVPKIFCVVCKSIIDGVDPKMCTSCIEAASEEIFFSIDEGPPNDAEKHTPHQLSSPEVETVIIKSPGAVIREKFLEACARGQVIEFLLSPKVPGQPQEVIDLTTPPSNNGPATPAATSNPQAGSPANPQGLSWDRKQHDDTRRSTNYAYATPTRRPTHGKSCQRCGSDVPESWMTLCTACYRGNSSSSKRTKLT